MIFVVKEGTGERKVFRDIFCMKKSAYPFLEKAGFFEPRGSAMAEKEENKTSEGINIKDIIYEDRFHNSTVIKDEGMPAELIERQRYRKIEEDFNGELFKNAEKITSLARVFIFSFVTAFVINLFYWILVFTPYIRYAWIIGNISSVVVILSFTGLISLLFYSFFTGRKITQNYDRFFATFDKELISEADYIQVK